MVWKCDKQQMNKIWWLVSYITQCIMGFQSLGSLALIYIHKPVILTDNYFLIGRAMSFLRSTHPPHILIPDSSLQNNNWKGMSCVMLWVTVLASNYHRETLFTFHFLFVINVVTELSIVICLVTISKHFSQVYSYTIPAKLDLQQK